MKNKITPLETKSKFLYLDFELINKKTTFLFLLVSTFFCVSVNAQSGYIYVHKKALNEKSSIDFPFTVSGGPTAVAPFSLNDGDGQLRVKDLGSSQNGRLWAIHETTNTLYYRNTNSNVWVQTSIADANRVDGDINGNAVYINTSGTVFSTDGTTTTQLSSAAAYSGTADIGSGWNGLPYVTRGGIIYQYSGAGITWNVVSDQSATYSSSAIDVDPTNPLICYVVVRNTASSTNSIIRVNAGVVTNIGAPSGMSNAASNIPRDVAVNDKAELFISAVATNWDVYKYTSSWSAAEVTSDASNLTGGVGGELWVTMNSGNQYFGQPTVPYYNIFTRATNGTNVYYIDDERVRTTAGNSILIPVLPGTYTITEALSTDWDLQAIRIEDPTNNSTSNQVNGTATIDVAAGEIVNVVFQNGQLNPIAMTASCTANYLEDFGTGAVGTFGSLVPGQTSYHFLDNTVRAEDGYCKVVSTAFPDFNNWRATPFYDHTSGNGTGRMYAVNAGYDLGEFFRRRFTGVVPGLTYNVSAWVANLTPGATIKPNIKFQIVDHITQAVIATYDTGNINTGTIQWNQYGFTFTATSSDIDLILSNNAIGGNGNDLAIDDISFSLTAPPTPTPTIGSVTQPTCSVANGNFTITNYSSANTYSITSATGTVVSGPTATGLVTTTAGVYTITASANGCTSAAVNVTVNAQPVTPAVPTVSPVTHPTCSVATGSFTITNYNATNTYTFVPAGPTIDASGVVTASTGSYTLTASANGCTSASVSVTVNAQPATPATPTVGSVIQPTCSVANGTFVITNYSSANTYSITSPTGTVVSGPTATGLVTVLVTVTAGSYTVTSTSNGCTSAPVNVTINAQPVTPAVPTVSPVTHPTCSVATGSFTITNYNATNTYTFVPAGPTIDASGVVTASTGSYTLTASANGCTSASVSVTVNAQPATPATPTIGSVTQPTCSVANGTFVITNYSSANTYSITSPTGTVVSGPTATGLVTVTEGVYTITANANGCTSAPVNVTINAQPVTPAVPTVSPVTHPTCSVATGSFTITNYNATNTYTFVPAGPTIDASGVVTASTGSYTLTASANGCTSASVSVTVNAQPATPATPTIGSVTQPTCSVANGTFVITNYSSANTYSITSPTGTVVSGPTATGLVTTTAGVYTITASANGCTSAAVNVTVNAQPVTPTTPTIGSVTQPTCSVANGNFTITNYSSANTYSITSATGTVVSGPTATGLVTTTAGVYTITASANGCTSAAVNVTVNAQPVTPTTPTIGSVTQPTCSVANGTFVITNYSSANTYSITSPTGTVVSGPTATGLVTVTEGVYTITANANGCTSAPVNVTINAQPVTPAVPTVSPVTHPTCSVATGSFTITNYNATNTYTFVPAGPTIDASGVVTASTGSYTLTASANGCTSASVSVTVNAQPATPATPTVGSVIQPTCSVANGTFVITNYSSANTYSITSPTGTVVSGPTATGLVTATAGVYTITANANGCTSAPVNVTINAQPVTPAVPTVSPVTHPTCSVATGSFTITNYNATNTYTFVPAGPTIDASGVVTASTGSYTLTASANGCTSASVSVTVNAQPVTPTTPTIGSVTQPTCSVANGNFTITNYSSANTYSITSATGTVVSGPTATGLVTTTAGVYTITASANGCTSASVSVTVNAQPATPATPTVGSVIQPTCSVANGTFVITNYSSANTYSITSPTGTVVSGPTATGLVTVTEGVYTITANANGCTSAPVNVTINAQPVTPTTPTIGSVTQPTCSVANGNFTITNYSSANTYSITSATGTVVSGPTATGLVTTTAGVYTITASANGCTSAAVNVTVNAQPVTPTTPTIGSVTQPTCSVANGNFTITNYSSANTYSITSATGTVVSGPTATGLVTTTAGVYTITASANGCTSAAVNVTVNAQPVTPTTPTIGSVTQPTCSVANGTFTITNYSSANTYSITSPTGTVVSGPTATGLVTTTAGVYTITASANGCTSAAVNATVNAQPVTPTTPTIGSVTQPTCSVATGSFTITNYNATNTYTFVPAGPTIDASGVVTASTGSYTLTASANGCTSASVSVTVNAQPATPATPTIGSVTQPTCSVANGTFVITNYSSANTYSITSPTGTVVSGPTATGLVTVTAGSYTVTSTSNGCTSAPVNVTINAQPVTPAVPTVSPVTHPTCSVATGSFTITNYNATNTYTFVPAGPTIDASGVVTASTGSYTLTASANGCTSASVSVTVNAQPATPATPTIGSVTQPTCSVANGTFVITNYSSANTYSITSPTGTVVSGPTATGLVTVTEGVYTITANANGCTSAPVNVTINAQPVTPAVPTVSPVTHPTCSVATGSFTITNYDATNTYTFVPAGPTIDASGVVTASTGSYTLTASANGCTSASVSVTVNAQPATPATPTIGSVTQPTCSVANGTFVITNYSSANTYSITSPTGTVVSGPTATGLVTVTAGSYTVTSTSNGCTSTPVVVVINPLECADIVTVKTDNQTSYVAGQPVTYVITVTNNGPTAATNVNVVDNAPAGTTFTSWSSSNGSGTGNINDTIATLAVGQTVTYTVNVDVPATLLGNLENTVTVTTTTPDPVPGCTTCTDIDTPNTTLAENDINNTFMNIPVSGSVLTNDSDPQGHTQTVTASTTTTPEGTLVLNADGTYTFTPATDFTGTFVHTYTVCDSGTPQACDTATLTIEVMPNPNDPDATNDVVANDDTATTEEGQPVTINILSNDFDPNGDTLGTPTVVTPPTNGTFDPVTGVYTPNPGFVGVDTFVYQVCDDATPQACDTAVVTITVNPTNPVNTTDANDDAYNGDQYQPINGSVLDNDNDIEGNTQTVTSNTQPQNGTVVMNPDGTFVYTPTGEYSGPDQFTYTVCDNGTPQACDTATVYLTINPANTTNAENDINNTFMNIPVSGSVLTNDSDPQGHTQTVTASTTTTPEGTLVLNADGTYTFTPATDFTGTFVHTYTVCDSGTPQACDTATLTIEVMPNPNDPDATNDVVANDDTATTEEGQPVTINILSNDFDPNGDTLGTPTVVTPPTNGTFDPVTGVYTPNPGFVGVDTFVYQVCDDATPQACDTAVVTITVNPTNPVNTTDANDDAYNGDQYQPINGSVLDNDNDIEGNTQTVTSNTQPQNGTVVMNPDGTFVYTPTGEYSGPDQFTYTVCDNGTPQACDTATVYLTINPANTTNAENDINNTFMNIPVSGSVLTNDSDPQGHTQTVTASITTTPEGTLVLNANGTYTFTPATGFTGTFVHTYTVCDNGTPQACDTATLTIEVLPIVSTTNDVVANNDTATTSVDQPVTINILSNDFDPNGDTIGTPTIVTPPSNGTFDPLTGVYIPNPGFVGVDTFVYQICDDGTPQACDTAVVTITIVPTNITNETYANDDAYNGNGPTITGNILNNDTDPEGNTQFVTSNTQPQHGTVVVNLDGTFVYTPTPGYYGPDSFVYTICDNGTPQACDTATVYLTVNAAPAIVITKDSSLSGNVITYTYLVTNTGNVPLTGVSVLETAANFSGTGTLPNPVYVSSNPSAGSNTTTLAVGATSTYTATYTLTQADIDAGQVDNLAVATGTDPNGDPITDNSEDPTPCPSCTPIDPTCTDCTIVEINQNPSIAIVKEATFNDNNGDGFPQAGETITYTFTVTNTGNMSLFDVIVTDPLPGIVLTGGPIDLAVGQSDSTTFTATYTITQADIVFGSVVNQATASAETIDGEVVDDLSDDDSELEDDPTIVILEGCKLTIFNAVSPNGDGSNDIFYIQGIECYPNNTVEVYNRWGIKVYEVNNYDNISNVFKGYSDGRVTISRNELLPTGTYFYIIKYVDLNGNGIDKSGYLYIQSN